MKNKLIFGSYNSQPVGTPDDVLEEYYQYSYKPFIQKLYSHPKIRAVVYYSGELLEWLAANHSEFLDVLSEMMTRRQNMPPQLEVIGGGFYEPIFSLIPRQDRVGQIELMTTMLRKQFGRRPRGCWLPECVWEQGLTSSLCSSGMEYTFLEDSQFARAGLRGDQLYAPAITEDQGKTVVVFPLHPGGQTSLLPDAARHQIQDGHHRLFVRLLSGEECTTERIDEVIAEVEAGSIETVLPMRYLRDTSRRQRVYFPSSSRSAMHAWAMPPQQQREQQQGLRTLREQDLQNVFVEGGFFRNFLIRYPEVSRLYAKMQYTHILVNQIRGDKQRKQAAREELWRGQHHCAYWHGSGSGVYSAAIRSEVYRSLILAEKMARERGIFKPSIISLDFDMDGIEEFLYQGVSVNAYVHTTGGALFELDSLISQQNYINTMGRYPEAYHDDDAAAFGYDSYSPTAFLDHFIAPDASQEDFEIGIPKDSSRFHQQAYRVDGFNRDQFQVVLDIAGPVVPEDAEYAGRVHIEKSYTFAKHSVTVKYRITNVGAEPLDRVFMPEINLAFPDLSPATLRVWGAENSHTAEEISPDHRYHGAYARVQFVHQQLNQTLSIILDGKTEIWGHPVRTMNLNRDGITAVQQQGCTILPRWRLKLSPGEAWDTVLSVQLS